LGPNTTSSVVGKTMSDPRNSYFKNPGLNSKMRLKHTNNKTAAPINY
jgi:hypothetical protein